MIVNKDLIYSYAVREVRRISKHKLTYLSKHIKYPCMNMSANFMLGNL